MYYKSVSIKGCFFDDKHIFFGTLSIQCFIKQQTAGHSIEYYIFVPQCNND